MHAQTHVLTIRRCFPSRPVGYPSGGLRGEIILRSLFLRQLGNTDFDLPFETPGLEALPPILEPKHLSAWSWSSRTNCWPHSLAGSSCCRDLGFTSLYLHSIPPPTLDDAELNTSTALRHPPAFDTSRRCCSTDCSRTPAPNDLRFLDIWNDVTVDNLLNPTFHVDGPTWVSRARRSPPKAHWSTSSPDDRPAMAQSMTTLATGAQLVS